MKFVALVYVTGVAGAGKSTVRQELLRRGYTALGGSEDDLAAFYNNASGQRVEQNVPVTERSPEWLSKHTWRLPKEPIEKLRSTTEAQLVFVCSGTANDNGLWGLFDKIIVLEIDKDTLKNRVASRTNGDWGKSPNELNFILDQWQMLMEEYQEVGATFIDSTQPVKLIADSILEACIPLNT